MIHIQCQCGRRFRLSEANVNLLFTCPDCRRPLRVAMAGVEGDEHYLEQRLVIRHGPHRQGDQIILGGDGPITVGRSRSNKVVLIGGKVSRRHAVLTRSNGAWRVDDNGSTNGMMLNGEPVRSHRLKPHDALMIGNYELVFLPGLENVPKGREADDLVLANPDEDADLGSAQTDSQRTERMDSSPASDEGDGLVLNGAQTVGQGKDQGNAENMVRGIEGPSVSAMGHASENKPADDPLSLPKAHRKQARSRDETAPPVAQNTFVDELVTDDIPGGDIDEETEVHTLHAEEPPTLRPAPPPPPTSSRSRDPQPENQSNKRRSVLELVRSVFRRG